MNNFDTLPDEVEYNEKQKQYRIEKKNTIDGEKY